MKGMLYSSIDELQDAAFEGKIHLVNRPQRLPKWTTLESRMRCGNKFTAKVGVDREGEIYVCIDGRKRYYWRPRFYTLEEILGEA